MISFFIREILFDFIFFMNRAIVLMASPVPPKADSCTVDYYPAKKSKMI